MTLGNRQMFWGDGTPLRTSVRTRTETATSERNIELLQSLLSLCSHGDEAAFAKLYELTRRKMFGIALMILHRSELAEEIVQEAYMRVWHKAGHFNPILGSPISWMATIVRNLAIDAGRRLTTEHGRVDEGALHDVPSLEKSALETIEAAERRGIALAVLKGLDPIQRSLIVAAYVRGYSREQLSVKYCVPASTIKTWLRRAILQAAAASHKTTNDG